MNVVPFATKATVLLFVKLLLALKKQKHAPDTTTKILKEYDYIVVGSGPGGSTVAARLSEKPCVNVLLLEAGRSPPVLSEIPLLARTFVKTDIDWNYYTVPQKNTGNGLINKKVFIPSGKVIGGSSIWNAMIYVRGAGKIYDKWAEGGATGWSYREVLPYFKKSETNKNPESIDIPYHGFQGPMTISKPAYEDPYRTAIQAAMRELGHHPVDVNGRYSKGFYDYQSNMRNGQRCSAAKAYLVPAENRKNLYIVKNAFVTKILIENRRAIGVQFDYAGNMYVIRAKREVILSAGARNTPKLLMLSGIGPREHLQEMNVRNEHNLLEKIFDNWTIKKSSSIPVIADLPVGLNLQDHPTGAHLYYTDQLPTILEKAMDPKNVAAYIVNGSGLMSIPEGQHYLMFGTNDPNSAPDAVPDYEIYFVDGLSVYPKIQFNLKTEVYERLYKPYEAKSQLWCFSQNLHSKSRGSIKLQSANPYDAPLIDPNFFDDPQDLIDMVEGMKQCDRIVNTHSMRSLGVKPVQALAPGCEKYAGNQDAYFACLIKLYVVTIGHQVGTAKMGNPYDPTTVVDPELRVKTIKGLRVVDASVMPLISNGNTNNPVLMIGEKAADMIKKDIWCSHLNNKPHSSTANKDFWWNKDIANILPPSIL